MKTLKGTNVKGTSVKGTTPRPKLEIGKFYKHTNETGHRYIITKYTYCKAIYYGDFYKALVITIIDEKDEPISRQVNFLFDDTIYNNYGLWEEVTRNEFNDALRKHLDAIRGAFMKECLKNGDQVVEDTMALYAAKADLHQEGTDA